MLIQWPMFWEQILGSEIFFKKKQINNFLILFRGDDEILKLNSGHYGESWNKYFRSNEEQNL